MRILLAALILFAPFAWSAGLNHQSVFVGEGNWPRNMSIDFGKKSLTLRDVEGADGRTKFDQHLPLNDVDFKILDAVILHQQLFLLTEDHGGEKKVVAVTFKRFTDGNQKIKQRMLFVFGLLVSGQYIFGQAFTQMIYQAVGDGHQVTPLTELSLAVSLSAILATSYQGLVQALDWHRMVTGHLVIHRVSELTDSRSGVHLETEIRSGDGQLNDVILKYPNGQLELLSAVAERKSCGVILNPQIALVEAQ